MTHDQGFINFKEVYYSVIFGCHGKALALWADLEEMNKCEGTWYQSKSSTEWNMTELIVFIISVKY